MVSRVVRLNKIKPLINRATITLFSTIMRAFTTFSLKETLSTMSSFSRISADQAKTLMEEPGTVIVDMRDQRSFDAGRVPGAKWINNDNVQEIINETDFEAHLIVCCYRGNISQQGADFFAQQGFNSVYSLDGGFNGWKLLFPTEVEL